MYVLGIKCSGHDTGAALVTDRSGALELSAISEARLNRRKHSYTYPLLSIRYVMERFGLKSLSEIDRICIDKHGELWPERGSQFGRLAARRHESNAYDLDASFNYLAEQSIRFPRDLRGRIDQPRTKLSVKIRDRVARQYEEAITFLCDREHYRKLESSLKRRRLSDATLALSRCSRKAKRIVLEEQAAGSRTGRSIRILFNRIGSIARHSSLKPVSSAASLFMLCFYLAMQVRTALTKEITKGDRTTP